MTLGLAVLLSGSLGLVVAPAPAQAVAPSCDEFSYVLYNRVNPTTQAQILTPRRDVAEGWAARGFTVDKGTTMTVATPNQTVRVHRLYRPVNQDFFYAADPAEIRAAMEIWGYQDFGLSFNASLTPSPCLVPVWSLLRDGMHRYVTDGPERSALIAAGWRAERIRFWVGPTMDTKFSIAVMPDTQQEVLRPGDLRFQQRSEWLVSQRAALDLKFVTHVGDVVNWDTPDHIQYRRAEVGLAPLKAAGMPYSLSIGNHDTAAVGPGGGAADTARTRTLVRDTRTFNDYLDDGTDYQAGAFEPGKVDNTFHTFAAGGLRWMVVNLELWPRRSAVEWAGRVIAAHPRHNVIVVTHAYLHPSGRIYDRAEYGETSPVELFNRLIRVHGNIRLVLSGHFGQTSRADLGSHNNPITSMSLTMHHNTTNPVRLIEVDTVASTVRSWVYAPYTRERMPLYDVAPRPARLLH